MRLFNQSKNQLGWSMSGQAFTCEPWGAVELPDELVVAARSRGLPLDVAPVAPELRAQARIADEQAAIAEAPLRALRQAAEDAQAGERAAKAELERLSVELSSARDALREERERCEELQTQLRRAKADKEAADALMSEQASAAAKSEERAIKAEALLAEKTKAKADKPKQPQAG